VRGVLKSTCLKSTSAHRSFTLTAKSAALTISAPVNANINKTVRRIVF